MKCLIPLPEEQGQTGRRDIAGLGSAPLKPDHCGKNNLTSAARGKGQGDLLSQLLCLAGCSGASEGSAWHPRAPQAAGNSLSLATLNKVGMSQSSAYPKGWGEESWQGSNRAPTGNQCPAALSRPRGKRCCWDAPGAPSPALLSVASIPGRGVLLPQWDEDGKTGWGLTFPQRTRLWRMRQVGMGSPSFQEEVKACTSPGIWWHFVT